MIIIDLNQVMISNLMAQSKGDISELPDKAAVRHSILNTIRAFNMKFKDEYGTLVCAADAADPWRRDIFPNYKHQRRKGRVESKIDWSGVFGIMSDIREELTKNMPYKILHVEKCEADDIIATLVAMREEDKYLIVSGDKDFIQLQKYSNVQQYSPILKKYVNGHDPDTYIKEHILKGDTSDGVPNVLSPDNTFVDGLRQRPLGKKKIENWLDIDIDDLQDEVKRNYQRNDKLINLDRIPEELEKEIMVEFDGAPCGDRSKLLNYFVQSRLKNLMNDIGEF